MSVLVANLKHFYQRRGLWVFYVGFLGVVGLLTVMVLQDPVAGVGHFLGYLIISLAAGAIVGELQKDVLSTPFSFCLPNHQITMKKLLFFIGAIINGVGTLVFLWYPGLPPQQHILVIFSGFSAGLICYWAALWCVMIVSVPMLCLVPFVAAVAVLTGCHAWLEYVIVSYPICVLGLGVALCGVSWLQLGKVSLARSHCGSLALCSADMWSGFGKWEKDHQARAAEKLPGLKDYRPTWVETFFLTRINRYGHLGKERYIWGALYTWGAMVLSAGVRPLLAGLFIFLNLFVALGYLCDFPIVVSYLIMGWMAGYQIRLPVRSSMLVGGGRNERYYAAVVLSAAVAIFLITISAVVVVWSNLLSLVLPDITLRGRTFVFYAVPASLLCFPLLLMPFGLIVQLMFPRRRYIVGNLVVGIIAGTVVGMHSSIFPEAPASYTTTFYVITISLLICAWVIFLLVLRHVCMKQCLVGQGK